MFKRGRDPTDGLPLCILLGVIHDVVSFAWALIKYWQ